ncbi:molybdopterin-dependent oxidoreductase [Hoyosella altamirensis]|uniref:DMSO/TMAO reductase YedYZ molybdopterin-dependent catalytic subunit n=1 Tax=Hoyosella altamirensis TaxID=616997 RepID=A0A839RTB2_9ACTN|nr:molybdopterin-dependent oxidoreductase [Hoyosella altamirensis]MBB3039143.1 DMSO/TMAO reductase YedYZ molybdopterin-dependent catalytic subunit [Hoyosella altamirensis]
MTATITPLRAITASVLAVAAALGAGHLAAGFISPEASPIFAVGNAVIDVTPTPMKEFAIQQFGEDNKNVLLGSIGLGLLVLAAIAGLASRKSKIAGSALIVILGAAAVAAALSRPTFTGLWLVPPAVSILAGVASFMWLHRAAAPASPDAPTEKQLAWDVPGLGRRTFLVSSTAVAVGAGAAALGGRMLGQRVGAESSREALDIIADVPAPPIPPGADFTADGTPTFITPNSEFYRVDTALTLPQLRADTWQLRIHGMVDREIVLTYDDLLSMPLVEKTITLVCVSNEVGGPYISTANFIGVSLADVLRQAGLDPRADQLATTSSDGWTCGTPVDVVMAEDSNALIAIGMNGEPLPVKHGFPVRMVVPGLYGYVSATKWLVDMEVTTFDEFDAYWVRRNWAERGPVKTMSRIDRPRSFAQVQPGRYVAAGIAWAQHTGIDRVEVRVDGGEWAESELSAEVNIDTWRMWRIELDLEPGSHRIECRATDRSGFTQQEERVPPIPDGATGWHSIAFSAEA